MPPCCNFEVACSFLGWGDPGDPVHRAIWFVGVEGGGTEWTENSLDHLTGRYFAHWTDQQGGGFPTPWTPTSQVEDWISKICCGVSQQHRKPWQDNWRRYRDEVVRSPLKRTSRIFLTNLFPLWRRDQGVWPETYEALFGYTGDGPAYFEGTYTKRWPQIRLRRTLCNPQAIICFGRGHWPNFRLLFDLPCSPEQPQPPLIPYPAQHILLVPFLGRGQMSDELANQIIGQLGEWGVTLP